MFKRNPIHVLALLFLASYRYVSAEEYHIIPNNSTSLCQRYPTGTCFTLAEFASNIKHLDQNKNLTLDFLLEEHVLTEQLTITTNHNNVTLNGQNSSNSLPTIKCQGTSGFEFRDIQSLSISHLEFTSCGNGLQSGAIFISKANNVLISSCHFIDNHARVHNSQGSAIYAVSIVAMEIEGSLFVNNTVTYGSFVKFGGTISVLGGNVASTGNHYINNSAYNGGVLYVGSGNISSANDQYINNVALINGGAIYVQSGSVSSTNNYCMNNSAAFSGGIVYVGSGNIFSTNDRYINNSAHFEGGAIYLQTGSISSTTDQFFDNSADLRGGAIFVQTGSMFSTKNQYIHNNADANGGAIFVKYGSISSTNDCYIKNNACSGGAIFISESSETENSIVIGDYFDENSADEGAVIHITGGTLYIGQSNITNNFARNEHVLYINIGLLFIEGFNFVNNQGSLYVSNTQVEFKGTVAFMNNVGETGGAITAVLSQISFNTTSPITICNNTATYGGGISLIQSSLHVHHSVELTYNQATGFGGAIYAYQSEIEFKPKQTQSSKISYNTASSGGAFCAIASNVQISNTHVHLNLNAANIDGGAMFLEQNSKIYLQKNVPDSTNCLKVSLDFANNSAEKGGAIYVADNTSVGVLCQGANAKSDLTECFIQTVAFHQAYSYQIDNFINTFFTNNTAYQSGSDIYGGLLDRCTVNPIAELVKFSPDYKKFSGFDYIKATTQIEHVIDYSQHTDPRYRIRNITKSDVKGIISSNAVQVEYCLGNVIYPNYNHPNVSIQKGGMFTVSLVAVDQVGNPVDATIITSFSSKSGVGRLKEGQMEQATGKKCTQLKYNVYSQDNSAQLHMYADGPCGSIGDSRKTINITFLSCTCPVGFQQSPPEIDCICECDQRLKQYQITQCSAENESILVKTNEWIGLTNYTNGTGLVIQVCPYDYCLGKPLNVSLSSSNSADEQCAYNRTGILCGMCKENLSLVFGSSRCQECSDNYISLLIPFAVSGIALVAFILLLNLTVATGTIHGLIFYANIVRADHSLFIPFATSTVLPSTAFMSWLNLDLGIEACFYNGMDSYGKFLLQLAFPTYVFIVIGTIIVLCEVSKKFTTFLGNRNPVAALCTLILLSYSKLTRIVITALQFTYLDYPDSSKIVWLYDANVPYFTVSHIPRFIATFIILILGTIYTVLLLFGQWFSRSDRRFLKWAKNTKYNAFIDAYQAPFTPKHRYWIGLLLLAQFTHNIVAAMATDSSAPILSAGCVALGLILLKLLITKIHKNRLQDSLETLFLTNIVVLAIATYHTRETNGNQMALVNISLAISFIIFLVILGYHFYKYILKGTRFWGRVMRCVQRKERVPNRRRMNQLPPQENEEPLFSRDTRNRYDQLREPDMDILDPVSSGHYRISPPVPVVQTPTPAPVVTRTVIDAIP